MPATTSLGKRTLRYTGDTEMQMTNTEPEATAAIMSARPGLARNGVSSSATARTVH